MQIFDCNIILKKWNQRARVQSRKIDSLSTSKRRTHDLVKTIVYVEDDQQKQEKDNSILDFLVIALRKQVEKAKKDAARQKIKRIVKIR